MSDMSEESKELLKVRREAKNTVLIDLFHIPKYRYELFRTLHPEITDVTEDDIEEITLNPVILNHPYNDLGLLIKDRMMIFVEAQSTWSLNILIRILLYLAMTYQDYISEHELNVYSISHPVLLIDPQEEPIIIKESVSFSFEIEIIDSAVRIFIGDIASSNIKIRKCMLSLVPYSLKAPYCCRAVISAYHIRLRRK